MKDKMGLDRNDFATYAEYRKAYRQLWGKSSDGKKSRKKAKDKYSKTRKGKKTIKVYSEQYYGKNSKEIKKKKNAYNKTPKGKKVTKRLNEEKRAVILIERMNGNEQRFIRGLYNSMKTRVRENDIACSFVDTKTSTGWEKFWAYYLKYVSVYGRNDYYTGEPFTFIHWDADSGDLRPMTNVSVDRIQPHSSGIGYVTARGRRKDNVVFTQWATNAQKNAVPIEIARRQVQAVDFGIFN